jgi:hypothetical protein
MPGAHHRGWIPPVRGCDAAAQPGNGTLSRYSDRQRSGNKHNQVKPINQCDSWSIDGDKIRLDLYETNSE